VGGRRVKDDGGGDGSGVWRLTRKGWTGRDMGQGVGGVLSVGWGRKVEEV